MTSTTTTVHRNTDLDLAGRIAKCGCGRERPSEELRFDGFFEYLGEGSRQATEKCVCKYTRPAHVYDAGRVRSEPRSCSAGGFTPMGPVAHDRFYCGCRGWD